MPDNIRPNGQLTLSLERFAVEELAKLARSRRKALTTLANSPLPSMKRHAAKRTAEAEQWAVVESECSAALAVPEESEPVNIYDGADYIPGKPAADVNEEGG